MADTKVKNSTATSRQKSTRPKVERQRLMATLIVAGIIELIDGNGDIVYYRQRGINQIPVDVRNLLISKGMLNRYWTNYKELPRHVSIYYEDEVIMGKAQASFPTKACMDIFGIKHIQKK